MRGEYKVLVLTDIGEKELPPRARRIQRSLNSLIANNGTTSACAENTQYKAFCTMIAKNYLRVRGEYATSYCTQSGT